MLFLGDVWVTIGWHLGVPAALYQNLSLVMKCCWHVEIGCNETKCECILVCWKVKDVHKPMCSIWWFLSKTCSSCHDSFHDQLYTWWVALEPQFDWWYRIYIHSTDDIQIKSEGDDSVCFRWKWHIFIISCRYISILMDECIQYIQD